MANVTYGPSVQYSFGLGREKMPVHYTDKKMNVPGAGSYKLP